MNLCEYEKYYNIMNKIAFAKSSLIKIIINLKNIKLYEVNINFYKEFYHFMSKL